MVHAATLTDVVAAVEARYPPRFADSWDEGIGLVVGDPTAEVRRVLLAVDPVQAVVDQAIDAGADMLLTHHPLLFRAVHSVAADTPKGKVVHDLIAHGIGLYVAHTNADSAPGGVSASLANALGLADLRPLVAEPACTTARDKLVTFVPEDAVDAVVDALAAAGAGRIGDYDRCAFTTSGTGTFRPGAGAHPTIGTRGEVETVREQRVEMELPRSERAAVVQALRAAHPYEEVAFDLFELATDSDTDPAADSAAATGTGRVGRLEQPMSLGAFADSVAQALPATAVGARVSGDLDQPVSTVGLVGGSGDFMLDEARRQGVDVYLTSDLRHHPASELREHPGAPALVDVPHWAAEWTWLPQAQRTLTADLAAAGLTVDAEVSNVCTDPWNHHAHAHTDSRSAL